VVGEAVTEARALAPIHERTILGGKAMIFEDAETTGLQTLGELLTPSISDLIIAKMGQGDA
jgi:ABC-2 type transport system ATP-binding protein